MELERLQIVDAIKGYKSKSVSYSRRYRLDFYSAAMPYKTDI